MFTFTTLVTFGGAFFASFPLFYSTSFGSAYWVWLLILFTFIIQAVSYEFQNKAGNLFGVRTFQIGLIINGILGPLLLGGAVATFFTGSNFIVEKGNITDFMQPCYLSLGKWFTWTRRTAQSLGCYLWYFSSIPCAYPRHTLY